MAYSGYLIKVYGTFGGTDKWVEFPLKYTKTDGYNITPNQRMETEAKRSVSGTLVRTTVDHTASKIEFNTPVMTNLDMDAMMTLLRTGWAYGSTKERRIRIQYYDMETDSYKGTTSWFYMPDIKFQIDHIDNTNNMIYYKETRVAFIEY